MARLFNPLIAPTSLQGIFHPNYAPAHQQASVLLGQKNSVSFKGQNGEAEIRLEADSKLSMVRDKTAVNEVWQRSLSTKPADAAPNSGHVAQAWRGDIQDELGQSITINTVAVVLFTHGVVDTQQLGIEMAMKWWRNRFS
jgi:anthranilate phosphoribosyltransferase